MKILITGGGIAGLTNAYWLDRFGFKVTVVEISPKLRDEGYVIDFHSEGVQIAAAMGIEETLSQSNQNFTGACFVNDKGDQMGEFLIKDIQSFLKKRSSGYISLMRGDLERTLFKALPKNFDIRFGESINVLKDNKTKVSVVFASGKKESFDLVIGADGIHSQTRALVFGPEKKFINPLGSHIFITRTKKAKAMVKKRVLVNIEQNKFLFAIPMKNGDLITLFGCNSTQSISSIRKDSLSFLKKTFGNKNLFASNILDQIKKDQFIFSDEVAQIKMKKWTKGRVALIGDAAACPTLLTGQGAIMAMTEAYVLAHELLKSQGDHKKAFLRYEETLMPVLNEKMKEASSLSKGFLPKTKLETKITQFFLKQMKYKFTSNLLFKGFLKPTIFDKGYPLER